MMCSFSLSWLEAAAMRGTAKMWKMTLGCVLLLLLQHFHGIDTHLLSHLACRSHEVVGAFALQSTSERACEKSEESEWK
jgi:hypothetical protein